MIPPAQLVDLSWPVHPGMAMFPGDPPMELRPMGSYEPDGFLSHLASLPWKEKPIWLWRKLLPSPAFMRYRYGVSGPWALAKAYAGRWWFGLRQAVRWRKG